MFEHTIDVRFHQVDGVGIVYFGRIFQFCHVAYEELLSRCEIDLASILAEGRWLMPLVHAEADFRRPIQLGDRIRVQLQVERVGRSSITYAYRLLGGDDGLRAEARLIHTVCDRATLASCPVPEEFLERLRSAGLTLPTG